MEIYFIGVDVGSASVRSAIFDQQGNRIAFAVIPIQQFHSNVDWVAQSSSDIWDQVCSAVKETVLQAKIDKNKIVSIGFDATCSLVAIGHDGSPISVSENGSLHEDIIMWMDHRAKKETTDINLTNDPVLKYVGGEVNVEMELPKILWLKNNHPERYQATWRFFETGVMGLARIYLATLQAIAYGTLHIIDTLTESGYQIDKIIMCGGATKNPLWLREYSDVTGREIVLVKEEDAVNLGAAILAAVAAKAFPNIQSAAQSMVASGITIKPNFNSQNFHKHKYRVYLQMYQDQQKYNQFMSLSD